MPAKRKEIQKTEEGKKNIARFWHPLLNRTVRFNLGSDAEWRTNLTDLNRIFLDESLWKSPPPGISTLIRDQWLPSESRLKYRSKDGRLRKGSVEVNPSKLELAAVTAERDGLLREREELLRMIEALEREVEHWKGKKLRKGPCPTLRMAVDTFLKNYTGRDVEHTEIVTYDLKRFIEKFGEKTTVDKLEGCEVEISAWLRGLKNSKGAMLAGSRRNHIRIYVLRMLIEAGVAINRKAVSRAGKKEIKASRGAIRWLSRKEAEAIAKHLSSPWKEMFQIQVAVGLRPDELLTLHRDNFNDDFSKLTLARREHLTLKTGSRTIPIPVSIRPLVEWRIRTSEGEGLLFPEPETKKAWSTPDKFNFRYRYRLELAATDAGIKTKMDCRIGRRTCASLLLQDNVSAEKIAALLGNTPAMILEHYGDPDVEKIELDKNVVGVTVKAS